MNQNFLSVCLRIVCAASSVLAFGMMMSVITTYHPGRLILTACEELVKSVKEKKRRGLLDYGKLESFLNRNGAVFHLGERMEPIRYTAVRLVTAALGLLAGTSYGALCAMITAAVCFWLPDLLLVYLNKRDNENLLPELRLVYQALAMQIRAGVYVTDALSEVYGSVQEKRLRAALLELSGDIVMKSDLDEALERFQGKFDNRYVDSLCITILQAMESGQAVELLGDITEQIKDMEVTVMERKKGSLDRSITFYQLGILAAVLAVVLYACVTHLFTAALSF